GIPIPASKICIPPMPTLRIHSRSNVIHSFVTLPSIQCHQTLGRAVSGGVRHPRTNGSSCPKAAEKIHRQALRRIIFFIIGDHFGSNDNREGKKDCWEGL